MDIEAAVQSADVETVRQLLAGDRRPPIPGPSLIGAVTRHNANDAVDMTRLLIEHGAEVNHATAGGFSPLFAAVTVASPPEVVRLLLSNGANANYISSSGGNNRTYESMRPLHMACQTGELEHARLLIDSGADVNPPVDPWGARPSAPLVYAAAGGHLAIVRLLLDRGAQVDSSNRFGETALHHASRNGHEAIARVLLDRGARVDIQTDDLPTPLAYACRWGHAAVARLLLDRSGPHAQVDGFHSVHGHLYNTCRYSETTEGRAGRGLGIRSGRHGLRIDGQCLRLGRR